MLSLERKQNLSLGSRITLRYPRLSHMPLNYLLGTSWSPTLLEAKNKYLVNIHIAAMICLTDFLELKIHKSSSVPPSFSITSAFSKKYYQRTLAISNISGHINHIHTLDIFPSCSTAFIPYQLIPYQNLHSLHKIYHQMKLLSNSILVGNDSIQHKT